MARTIVFFFILTSPLSRNSRGLDSNTSPPAKHWGWDVPLSSNERSASNQLTESLCNQSEGGASGKKFVGGYQVIPIIPNDYTEGYAEVLPLILP